jgi:hypothetical protein
MTHMLSECEASCGTVMTLTEIVCRLGHMVWFTLKGNCELEGISIEHN